MKRVLESTVARIDSRLKIWMHNLSIEDRRRIRNQFWNRSSAHRAAIHDVIENGRAIREAARGAGVSHQYVGVVLRAIYQWHTGETL